MKSLSDYAKILRDTATNLNLHGESVEMVVQMLANALYISEVEHVTYSQEASLERATLENSKIQHCVNQMYSVYRGANPRVLMNFKAQKLFRFNPHDEIIKSNNFKVYYLGYFDHTTGEIIYSAYTVAPESSVTILGLMAAEIHEETWDVTEDNTYYHNIPISNLSGDLYMYDISSDTETPKTLDVTRIFNDHLRSNDFFDLTLPGYGSRIYIPEYYNGIPREKQAGSLKLSINIYKYLELSDIQESEKKALKMNGAILQELSEETKDALKIQEDYPGITYIPETLRDGVDTIHHKANRHRYAGTFMATNSDLSYLLEEYYPSKIRRSGVTYRFTGPTSSREEIVKGSYNLLDENGELKDYNGIILEKDYLSGMEGWTNSNLPYLPEGRLKLKYKKIGENTDSKNISYDILPSSSTISVRTTGTSNSSSESNTFKTYLDTTTITIQILKNNSGFTSLISTSEELYQEGLILVYKLPSVDNRYYALTRTSRVMEITNLGEGSYNLGNLSLDLYLVSTKSGLEITGDGGSYTTLPAGFDIANLSGYVKDYEVLPVIYNPVVLEEVSEGEDQKKIVVTKPSSYGSYYNFDLKDDTLYVQSDYEGNLTSDTTFLKTKASLFFNGKEIVDGSCFYSYYPISGISLEVNSITGEITILGMDRDVSVISVIISADYNGTRQTAKLTVKKSIINLPDEDKPVNFSISVNDGTNVVDELKATWVLKEYVLEIPRNSFEKVLIQKESDSIDFVEASYEYTYSVIHNTLGDGEVIKPALYLYYIPYSNSNYLSTSEIEKFVSENKAYYVTQDIHVKTGTAWIAEFNISLELYKNTFLDDSVLEILDRYSHKFGMDFGGYEEKEGIIRETDIYREIKSLITKISEVKNVTGMEIKYFNSTRTEEVDFEEKIKGDLDISYFEIECNISSTMAS